MGVAPNSRAQGKPRAFSTSAPFIKGAMLVHLLVHFGKILPRPFWEFRSFLSHRQIGRPTLGSVPTSSGLPRSQAPSIAESSSGSEGSTSSDWRVLETNGPLPPKRPCTRDHTHIYLFTPTYIYIYMRTCIYIYIYISCIKR